MIFEIIVFFKGNYFLFQNNTKFFIPTTNIPYMILYNIMHGKVVNLDVVILGLTSSESKDGNKDQQEGTVQSITTINRCRTTSLGTR